MTLLDLIGTRRREPEPAAVIRAIGLSRSFDDRVALDDLHLDVRAGEVLALLGPNGAGKTTTVRLLNGVLTPTSGAAEVLDMDPATHGNEVRRRTGVLTETAGLDDRLTARENLETAARIRGYSAIEARRRVDEQLERFDMATMADVRTTGFSTGQRKRLALARALVHDPEVLFLDEPTSGLDPSATREVTDLIGSLARDRGRTILLCTHFLGEAGRIADRMAVLDHGRLHAIGRPDELAAELWQGVPAELDLGGAPEADVVSSVAACTGVRSVVGTATGLAMTVDDRDTVARVIADLTRLGVSVYGGGLRAASVEDVYFAIEYQIAERARTGHPPGGESS